MFAISEQREDQVDNPSLYEACRYLKELLTESLENVEYKKNLASVLQRKEHFKKILLHIKELNNREEDSDDSEVNKLPAVQQEKDNAKVQPEVEFYLNYMELEVLKYEECCFDERLSMSINPREFLRIFNDQNIKHILDGSYKLNLIRFENKELHIFGTDPLTQNVTKRVSLSSSSATSRKSES